MSDDVVIDHGPDGASAVFSVDRKYRYDLERRVIRASKPSGPILVACGLNPSTANAFEDDPTIRRELGFARIWGCVCFVKVNAYAWRQTNPKHMIALARTGQDVVGSGNDVFIIDALSLIKEHGGVALACWGKNAKPDRVSVLKQLAAKANVTWMCLGTNKDGSPRHPLYLPYDTALVPWEQT